MSHAKVNASQLLLILIHETLAINLDAVAVALEASRPLERIWRVAFIDETKATYLHENALGAVLAKLTTVSILTVILCLPRKFLPDSWPH